MLIIGLTSCANWQYWQLNIPTNTNSQQFHVTIAPDYSTTTQLLYGGQQSVTIAKFKVDVTGNTTDTCKLTQLILSDSMMPQNSGLAAHLNNIILTDGINSWPGGIINGDIYFHNTTIKIPAGNTVLFTVMSDVNAVVNTTDSYFPFQLKIKIAPLLTVATGIQPSSYIPLVGKLQTIVRGRPVMFKTNITPSFSEFARIDVTALGNIIQITGLNLGLINVVNGNANIIQVYSGGLGGDLVYAGPVGNGAITFNQQYPYVGIAAGQTKTFSIKVLNPIATLNGNVPNPMGISLNNLVYDDVLDNGLVSITNVNVFKNTGSWPFIWSQ